MGRVIRWSQPEGDVHLKWNAKDQLVEYVLDAPGQSANIILTEGYDYWPNGMRAERTWVKNINFGTERYYGIGGEVSGKFSWDATHGEQLVQEYLYEGLDRPLAMIAHDGAGGEDVYYHLTNERGDVYALTNRAGEVVERYQYSLYGDPTVYVGDDYATATQQSSSSVDNPFMFGGVWYDDLTGLYQMRHRYYDPSARRFLSRDPLFDDSLGNLYAPFERNGYSWHDPWGLSAAKSEGGREDFFTPFETNSHSVTNGMIFVAREVQETDIYRDTSNFFENMAISIESTINRWADEATPQEFRQRRRQISTNRSTDFAESLPQQQQALAFTIFTASETTVSYLSPMYAVAVDAQETRRLLNGELDFASVSGTMATVLTGSSTTRAIAEANAGGMNSGIAVPLVRRLRGRPVRPDLPGPQNTHVYVGVRDGENVYGGITNNIRRRAREHGSRFEIQQITDQPVTRDQARSIEQALIERNSGFENIRNSISPDNPNYHQAVQWGRQWLQQNGY